MKRKRICKNNRGDSLILVIGAIAMLSLLGIVILAKTLNNQTLKKAEEQVQQTFFKADSSSAEMATLLETKAQEAIERGFFDLLIEHSLSGTEEARKNRFSEFFVESVTRELADPTALQTMLSSALGTTVSDLTVTFKDAVSEDPIPERVGIDTKTVRIKNAKFEYTANGARTSITTDICVSAKIPDLLAGTTSGMNCEFSDFAIISDGEVSIKDSKELTVKGNAYIGGDLKTGSNGASTAYLNVSDADKLLVRKNLILENNANASIVAGAVTMAGGQGLWANGIEVKGGTLTTDGVNVYVSDDMVVEGRNSKVEMKGGNEYVGYSGNSAATLNHEKSSAITINTVSGDTVVNLGELGALIINGTSYIHDENWAGSVDGIMQGESVAYKDMQSMYLVPGSCLNTSHNPVIGSVAVSIPIGKEVFTIEENNVVTYSMKLKDYVNETEMFKTRTTKTEIGEATYAYLNFASEASAVKYVKDYLVSPMANLVKSHITGLGSSGMVKLPTNIYTKGNALSYVGGNLEMKPAADTAQSQIMLTNSLLAKQRYGGLFSSLRLGTGLAPATDYKLLESAILTATEVTNLRNHPDGTVEEIWMTDPLNSTKNYGFVVYKGDYEFNGGTELKYRELNGILLVDGTVYINNTVDIKGMILATGGIVSNETSVKVTKDERAVEMLLTQDGVAKYFKGFANDSTDSYLSSEAVDVTFDNWKRN